MSTATDQRERIQSALGRFAQEPLSDAARGLFEVLGYTSPRDSSILQIASVEDFFGWLDAGRRLESLTSKDQADLHASLTSLHFLFQLTDDEIRSALGATQLHLFESSNAVDNTRIESYLVFAADLTTDTPRTRTALARLVRLINKPLPMPALVLFRQEDMLTLGVINRRLHKRDATRDVLDKVTLVKDVVFADPLRAHTEILHDLSLDVLHDEYRFHNFVGLHQAWEKRLGSYALNERFYREIADWYFWVLTRDDVILPHSIETSQARSERDKQRSIFFIRLLTRLIFCWFLQEKRLIPRDLFRTRVAEELLKDASPEAGTYYRAFLQNLFFASLNQEQVDRGWRKKYKGSRDGNRGTTNLWRYQDLVTDPDRLEALLRDGIPFVNGGLFDCLDDQFAEPMVFLDGFSERRDNEILLPNDLFFGPEREVDLSAIYNDKRRRREKVRGLIEILSHYKFTVEENTPLEEEIALDPELLGKVFENLLASYSEDTRTIARKALGAFYTPREIVRYMVDETLINYLETQLGDDRETQIRALFDAQPGEFVNPFRLDETSRLIAAIGRIKVLDPACGSGAFLMGTLQRLVDLLQKLDPNNESWKRDRLTEAEQYLEVLRQTNASKEEIQQVEARIKDIRHSFDTRFHALDFGRKLYLIENCIYGVDIQPIACQIAKLRFFITLIVDQHVDLQTPNLGVRPLPNLEAKIVAGDSLVPVEKPSRQLELLEDKTRPLRRQLEQVRHDYFNARTPARKARCRQQDKELRIQIAEYLRQLGLESGVARILATWDPYDQNHAASFFDPEWMFGLPIGKVRVDATTPATVLGSFALVNEFPGQQELTSSIEIESGFDIVIGNPPYVRIQTLKRQNPETVAFYKEHYEAAQKGNYDLYVVFVEAGLKLLKADGQLAYILPHKFFNAQYGEPLRALIAKGRHLRHVVHFGDQQIFPGASNYVCLLFLAQAGTHTCRFVRGDDLQEWLRTYKGIEGTFPASAIGAEEWNFVVGEGGEVFERLMSISVKLEDVTDRIFQGLKTSADKIYILEEVARTGNTVRLLSSQTGQEHELEPDLLHPLIKGGDSKAYVLTTTDRRILFPYAAEGDAKPILIPASSFQKRYPLTWSYLEANRKYLEEREGGAMRGESWYAYGRNQAIDVVSLPKLFTPDIARRAAFSYDAEGMLFFSGGVAGGYGILPSHTVQPELLLGLLNSRVVDFCHHKTATQMRGGWFSYESRFIKHLPIVTATSPQESAVVCLVKYLLSLNRYFAENETEQTARDSFMLGYFEQVLNGLVYELYFPDELHASSLHLFDIVQQAKLPAVDSIPEAQRLDRLREAFERIYHRDHPLRGALHTLRSLETVRIIEGGK